MQIENPFDIIKAVDYTDNQILDYWVEYSKDQHWFRDVILQSNRVPLLLLGSKGSGKTHILRYFSFEIQKLRFCNNVNVFKEDGFVGIYLRCSCFLSSRFSGNNKDAKYWCGLFQYYLDLWLAQLSLGIYAELKSMQKISKEEEKSFCEELCQIFTENVELNTCSFLELSKLLHTYQREIDVAISQLEYENLTPAFKIRVFDNSLTSQIPKLAKKCFAFFSKVNTMYLIDELENLDEEKQKVIQTLIREKDPSYSFVIGSRLYGVRTLKVLGSDEENKEGSEYKKIQLDSLLREDFRKYSDFIQRIYASRIGNHIHCGQKMWNVDTKNDFLTQQYVKERNRGYIKTLQTQLKNYIGVDTVTAHEICEAIKDEDLVRERLNVYMVYKYWKSVKSAKDIPQRLQSYARLIKDKAVKVEELRKMVLRYFRNDIIDTIRRELHIKEYFYTFEDLIKLSAGTPRVFLNIMKFSFTWFLYNHNANPLTQGYLDGEALRLGIDEMVNWFETENAMDDIKVSEHRRIISRLGRYLEELRYSNLPPQCSINIFSISEKAISPKVQTVIDSLLKHSLLLESSSRVTSARKSVSRVYQINPALSPKWNLSLEKRGNVKLDNEAVNMIFCQDDDEEFDSFVKNSRRKYNAPFELIGDSKSVVKQTELDFFV